MEHRSEISRLPAVELQAPLYAACSTREEVTVACSERGDEIDRVLRTKREFYKTNPGVWPVGFFYKL